MSGLRAAVAYFAIAFAAGFALGAARELVVVPRIGALAAVMIEVPIMLAVSWFAAGWVVGHWHIETLGERAMVGVIAFALLQAAEFGLGLAMGRGAAAYGRDLLTQRGQIGFAAQLAFAVLPLLVRPRP